MKDRCFQFVINVSRQGNNVKMKYNLKNKFAEIAVLFSFIKLRHTHNPVKQVT